MALSVADAQSRLAGFNLAAPIVSTVDAPGGGTWALGADGGVFALDGAPYFGSAVSDFAWLPEVQNQQFARIERDLNTGGYRLISKSGAVFGQAGEFAPPQNQPGQGPPPTPAPPSTPPPVDTEAETAEGVIRSILRPWGLESLTSTILERAVIVGPELAVEEIKDSQQYKARFPAMDTLRQRGRAISEAEYLSYERQATQMFREFGLPPGLYDKPEDFAEFIGGEVSVKELGTRIQLASQAAMSAPPEVRQQLQNLYGVGPGGLTAYWLDPDKALPELEKQMLASQVSAAGVRTGFGALTREESERLAGLSVSEQAAQQGLGQLAGAQGLFEALPGTAEGDISREQQLAATFEGNAGAQERIQRRQRRRQSAFEGGGGFAAGEGGISGLGG